MSNFSFPHGRGDVKYYLNQMVSPNCAWITQDYTQFASIAGVEFSSVDSAEVSIGTPYYTLIRVSDNGSIQIKGSYSAYDGSLRIELYESPTVTDEGTAVATTCQNLAEYNKDSHTLIYSDPTVSDDGDLIIGFNVYGSANAASRISSTLSSGSRRVLKSGTDYIVKVIALDNGVQYQTFLEWAECYRMTEND